ncbi:hypothetical protein [Actinophytocola sp. KF-1]
MTARPPLIRRLRATVTRPRRTRVTLANFAIVTTATVTTGVVALLAEDMLPKPQDGSWFVLSRWITAVVLLVALVAALSFRAHVHRTTGTLFYVHALDEGMADRQTEALAVAAERHMATRSISRWTDLPDRTSPTGVIDVVDVCAEVGALLEQQINDDSQDTGYVVAPNLLWPMALSIGAYLPHTRTVRLLELTTDWEISLTDTGSNIVEKQLEQARSAGPVGVWIALAPNAAHFNPNTFTAWGMSRWHILTYPEGPPTRDQPCPHWTATQLEQFPAALADALVSLKNTAREEGRDLVVVAMMPKVVALALGRQLALRECRFFTGTHLMHYDHTAGYLPMRVRPNQPTAMPTLVPDEPADA